MSALEHARRHTRPRYNPVAPNRGGKHSDPNRVEHTHPSWCRCRACHPPGPADGGRGRAGGCASLAALLLTVAAICTLAVIVAGEFVVEKIAGAVDALLPFLLGVSAIAIGLGIVFLLGGRAGVALIFGSVL